MIVGVNMGPSPAVCNSSNDTLAQAQSRSNGALGLPSLKHFKNAWNIGLRSLGIVIGRASVYPRFSATFFNHVLHVLLGSARKKMGRSKAWWVIALVANVMTLRDWSIDDLECESMGVDTPAKVLEQAIVSRISSEVPFQARIMMPRNTWRVPRDIQKHVIQVLECGYSWLSTYRAVDARKWLIFSPSNAKNYKAHGASMNGKHGSNLTSPNSHGVEVPDYAHGIPIQFGRTIIRTVHPCLSVFTNLILCIPEWCVREQMGRAKTPRIVAMMANVIAWRNRSTNNPIGNNMGRCGSSLVTDSTIRKMVQTGLSALPFQARIDAPWKTEIIARNLFQFKLKIFKVASLVLHLRAPFKRTMLRPTLHQQRGLPHYTATVAA